jgi:flagellin
MASGASSIVGNTQTTNASNARSLLVKIDDALTQLNTWRADYGSTQNQIESSLRTLNTAVTNLKAAESIIRDVDYASESARFNKQNIMAQAGTYAISQANATQKNVLRLLQ